MCYAIVLRSIISLVVTAISYITILLKLLGREITFPSLNVGLKIH